MSNEDKHLVLMTEELFIEFIRLLTVVNKKKFAIEWGEAVGEDYTTGEKIYVPTVRRGPVEEKKDNVAETGNQPDLHQ